MWLKIPRKTQMPQLFNVTTTLLSSLRMVPTGGGAGGRGEGAHGGLTGGSGAGEAAGGRSEAVGRKRARQIYLLQWKENVSNKQQWVLDDEGRFWLLWSEWVGIIKEPPVFMQLKSFSNFFQNFSSLGHIFALEIGKISTEWVRKLQKIYLRHQHKNKSSSCIILFKLKFTLYMSLLSLLLLPLL